RAMLPLVLVLPHQDRARVAPAAEDGHVTGGRVDEILLDRLRRFVALAVAEQLHLEIAFRALGRAVELDLDIRRQSTGQPERVVVRALEYQLSGLDAVRSAGVVVIGAQLGTIERVDEGPL